MLCLWLGTLPILTRVAVSSQALTSTTPMPGVRALALITSAAVAASRRVHEKEPSAHVCTLNFKHGIGWSFSLLFRGIGT